MIAAFFISQWSQARSDNAHGHVQRHWAVDASGATSLLELQEPRPFYVNEDLQFGNESSKADWSTTVRQLVTGSTPTGVVQLGTPAKDLNMIFDTGSDKFVAKTWLSIKKTLERIEPGIAEFVKPTEVLYNHNESSTYTQILQEVKGKKEPKQGFIAYGSGMAYTAEGKERVLVGNFSGVTEFPISEISMDSLQVLHTNKGVAGILGLQHMKNKSLGVSLYSMLRESKVIDSFGYCRDRGNNGTFIWGDKSDEGTELEVIGQMHWAIEISDVKLGEFKKIEEKTDKKKEPEDKKPEEKTDKKTDGKPAPCHGKGKHGAKKDKEDAEKGGEGGKKEGKDAGKGGEGGKKEGKDKEDLPESVDWSKEDAGKGGEGGKKEGKDGADSSKKEQKAKDDVDGGNVNNAEVETKIAASASKGNLLQPEFDESDSETDPISKLKEVVDNLRKATMSGPDSSSEQGEEPDSEDKVEVEMCTGSHKCVAVIDTGSNIIAMPSTTVQHLTKVLDVKTDCSNLDALPDLHFKAGDKMQITIPPAAYVMKVSLPSFGADSGGGGGGGGGGEMDGYQEAGYGSSSGLGNAHGMSGGGMGGGSGGLGFFEGSLMQEDSKVKDDKSLAELRQAAILNRIRRSYGLDLRMILRAKELNDVMESPTGTAMCMLALVPIDRMTQKGALWVVGGPLFEKYYTRWSWPEGKAGPSVFLKELANSSTCQPAAPKEEETKVEKQPTKNPVDFKVLENGQGASVAGANDLSKDGEKPIIRSEPTGMVLAKDQAKPHHKKHHKKHSEGSSGSLMEMPMELREMKLEDIRFPHWAAALRDI